MRSRRPTRRDTERPALYERVSGTIEYHSKPFEPQGHGTIVVPSEHAQSVNFHPPCLLGGHK